LPALHTLHVRRHHPLLLLQCFYFGLEPRAQRHLVLLLDLGVHQLRLDRRAPCLELLCLAHLVAVLELRVLRLEQLFLRPLQRVEQQLLLAVRLLRLRRQLCDPLSQFDFLVLGLLLRALDLRAR